MIDLTRNGRQMIVRIRWGFLPVLMVRETVPDYLPGDWKWGRWRYVRLTEVIVLNSRLMETWRD